MSLKTTNRKIKPTGTWSWFPCPTPQVCPNSFLHISCDYPSATNTKIKKRKLTGLQFNRGVIRDRLDMQLLAASIPITAFCSFKRPIALIKQITFHICFKNGNFLITSFILDIQVALLLNIFLAFCWIL